MREQVGSAHVLLALSGGVDSSVCAVLLSKAIPGQVHCIFVDHGLMRKNEGDEIERAFRSTAIHLVRVNAAERFLAALKGVPEDLYEAASIDGATKGRQFLSITIPLISPVIFYNLVTQLVQAFQEFNGPYIITNGGPRNATTLISVIVYNTAFKDYKVGMSSAMAWVMFVIVMILTIIAFVSQKKWVYYSDDDGRG